MYNRTKDNMHIQSYIRRILTYKHRKKTNAYINYVQTHIKTRIQTHTHTHTHTFSLSHTYLYIVHTNTLGLLMKFVMLTIQILRINLEVTIRNIASIKMSPFSILELI